MKTNHTYLNSLDRDRWFFILMPIVCLLIPAAHAATRTWDGGGSNGFWSTPANWVSDVAPVAGDDLLFSYTDKWLSNTNDFPPGTSFSGIRFDWGGYVLRGSEVTLTGGIILSNSFAGENRIEFSIVLSGSQTFFTDLLASLRLGTASSGTVIDTTGGNLTFAGNTHSVSAQIVGSGGITKTGGGSLFLFSSNSFTGPVEVQQGTVRISNASALGTTAAGTTILQNGQLQMTTGLTVAEPLKLSGTLAASNFQGSGFATNSGPIELIGTNASMNVESSVGLSINSIVTGSNGFTKLGGYTLILSSNNTYQGATVVRNGNLLVNGSQRQSAILIPEHGRLGGAGTVGDITIDNSISTLSPGDIFGGVTGILTCSNVTIIQSAEFRVELNGAIPGVGYDQLNVFGTVNLISCRFRVLLGFPATAGTKFVIIANDGSDAVQGMFQNLPDGAVFTASGALFQISYTGGDGNDVVLTRLDSPQRLTSITSTPGSMMQIQGAGLSNVIYSIQAAANLGASIQWSNVGTATGDLSGTFWFTDTNAPFFPQRFYRAVYP